VSLLSVISSGCVSSYVYTGSKEQIAQRRLMASGDEQAINMFKSGVSARQAIKIIPANNNGFAFAVDIMAVDTLKERPLLQFGAAVLDAAGTWGLYRLGEHNNWGQGSSSHSKEAESDHQSSQSSGENRNAQVTVNGDYNEVTVSQSSQTQ